VNRILLFLLLFCQFSLFAQPELIFHSGFEPGTTTIDQNEDSGDLTGVDLSMPTANDWDLDLDDHPNIGRFEFRYQDGNETQRLADLLDDPTTPGNKVLNFRIDSTESSRGRVQTNLYSNEGLTNFHYSTRLYLPANLNALKEAPFSFDDFNLMEFYNNANWSGEGRRFKMSLDLIKETELTDSLHFRFQSKNYSSGGWNDDVWGSVNESFIVPVQKWMTLDIYFQEGNACQGRFVIRATVEGEAPVIVFDVKNCTNHPYDTSPDGMAHFNPMKLYAHKDIVDHVGTTGTPLNINWDDFSLWKDSFYVDTEFGTNHPNIKEILGTVNVESSTTDPIVNLDALSNIIRIKGGLKIENNNNLANIEGLAQLKSIGGSFELRYNPALMAMSLDSLTCIGIDFRFTGNENIENFMALNGMLFIGRHLEIRKSGLVNLNGLELLERIGGRLVLEENDDLINTNGLINLRDMVGSVSILDNPSLPDLSGLANLKAEDIEFLFINNNTSLTFCSQENICEYIEDGQPAQIMNNAWMAFFLLKTVTTIIQTSTQMLQKSGITT